VALQSPDAVIVRNLVLGTLRSPDSLDMDWTVPFAGFYIAAQHAEFSDNVAAGSEDTGMVFIPDVCGEAPRTLRNEVHSALVGVFVLTRDVPCVAVRSVTAWKCSHVGVITVDQRANVDAAGVVVADNHIGLSFNYIRGGYGYTRLHNSLVMGSTPASASCAQSTVCRAMNKQDVFGTTCRSVYGAGWRRVGLMSAQYTNLGKTCGASGFTPCVPITTPDRMWCVSAAVSLLLLPAGLGCRFAAVDAPCRVCARVCVRVCVCRRLQRHAVGEALRSASEHRQRRCGACPLLVVASCGRCVAPPPLTCRVCACPCSCSTSTTSCLRTSPSPSAGSAPRRWR
jgi:hypothetical protein